MTMTRRGASREQFGLDGGAGDRQAVDSVRPVLCYPMDGLKHEWNGDNNGKSMKVP